MVAIFICVVVLIAAYLLFTKNGQKIKSRMSGAVEEKLKEDAMTAEGAKSRYNMAIREKRELYSKAAETYTKISGRLDQAEEELHLMKKDMQKIRMQIDACLDNNNDERAMTYATRLANLEKDVDKKKEYIKELKDMKIQQQEIRDRANEEVVKLQDEKKRTIDQIEADQQMIDLHDSMDKFKNTTVNQEALEEVRDSAKQLNEKASGSKIAYESSADALDYRMEQEEKQRDAEAILNQIKNSRKK